MSIPDQIKKYCREHSLIHPGDKILLAVSGGPDSVALLHIFNSIKGELGVEISTAHLEHGIRGKDSVEDQTFVRELADNLKIDFYTKNLKVSAERKPRESLEEAARRIRYQYLFELLQRVGYTKIATGHTLDDNIETILYRFVSGTGPVGFVGMLPETGNLIHPLLELTKEQILCYLDENRFEYRIDHTNFNMDIVRNRMRHELVPLLSNINPRSREHILNLIKILREENSIIDALVYQNLKSLILYDSGDTVRVDYKKFLGLAEALRRRVVIKVVEKIFSDNRLLKKRYIPSRGLSRICSMRAIGNKILYDNSFLIVQKEYNDLIITKRVVNKNDRSYLYYSYKIGSLEERLDIHEIGKSFILHLCENKRNGIYEKSKIHVDYRRVGFPLEIRSRKSGDRIELPKIGSKKLKTIFINDKVPPHVRNQVPIVVSGNEIIGIFGAFYGKQNRVAQKYLVSEDTERILVFELI